MALFLDFDSETPKEKGIEELIRGYFPKSVIFDNNTNIQEYALKTYNDLINHKEYNKTKYENLLTELETNKIKKTRKGHSDIEHKKSLYIINEEHPYIFSFKNKEFYFDETNRIFYKKYVFDSDNAFLSILREIILHKYAFHLLEKYKNEHFPTIDKIKIPKLYDIFYNDSENNFSPLKNTKSSYKKSPSPINNENNTVNKSIIIKYELLDIYTLQNDGVNEKIKKNWLYYFTLITDIFEYFKEHHLFHNDTKRDNVCFLRDEYKIDNVNKKFNILAIFDFGEATLLEARDTQLTGFTNKKYFEEIVNDAIKQNKSLTLKNKTNKQNKSQTLKNKNIIKEVLEKEKKSFNAWFMKSENNPISTNTEKYGGKHQKKTHKKTHKKTKRNKRKQIKTKKQYNKTK